MMDSTIGILGGGQLGRMLTEAANQLNIKTACLDAEFAPAKQVNASAEHVIGSFKDAASVRRLAKKCDILTVEIEHVDTFVLEAIGRENDREDEAHKVDIQPHWNTIRIIQDKFLQKEHLSSHNIPVAEAFAVPTEGDNTEFFSKLAGDIGYPFMLKSRTEAYDGKGNAPVRSQSELSSAIDGLKGRPLYVEQWASFKKELAVMVVKVSDEPSSQWETTTKSFPVAETIHEESVCKLVYAPAEVDNATTIQLAQKLARRAVSTFRGKGVFGVEMFLMDDNSILINEIAPRPHNSGHYTMELCAISQYDAHLRAILDLPIPEESLQPLCPNSSAAMLNILGGKNDDSHTELAIAALSVPGTKVHLYGKGNGRPMRKMGHITTIAPSRVEASRRIAPLIEMFNRQRDERIGARSETKQTASTTNIPDISSAKPLPTRGQPLVAVTMGSESDRAVLAPGLDLLEQLEIPFSVTITSAHRTPERMVHFAREASTLGIRVIIAAAGGAAHLPGMIAANSWLPVIGVPVRASVLDGLDSLLSIVQMPRGCPVATVAINNSINAAQLAARILATQDGSIRKNLQRLLSEQTSMVEKQACRMEMLGIKGYDIKE